MSDGKRLDVGHLAVRLLQVRLPMALVLDEVILQGEDLTVNDKPLSVKMPSPGALEVRIGESALAAFLEHKAPGGLSGFQVRLTNGEIHVQALARVIIAMNVGAVCKLRIVDGKQLFVDLHSLEALGGQTVFQMVQSQLDRINPVLDVKDLPVSATLTGVEVKDSMLLLYGSVLPL